MTWRALTVYMILSIYYLLFSHGGWSQNKWAILSFTCLFLKKVLRDIEDALNFKGKYSIFPVREGNYWDPNAWKKKFIDFDPERGQRYWNILGLHITIPAWWPWRYGDAWHTAKFIGFWLIINCVIFLLFWFADNGNINGFKDFNYFIAYIRYHKIIVYISICSIWALLTYAMHQSFYGKWFIRNIE